MDENFDLTYKALFRRYYPSLIFYATRLVGEEEAEDVVQDVFVELWKRKDSIEIGEQIQAFLYRAVYTRALNVLKHRNVEDGYCTAMEDKPEACRVLSAGQQRSDPQDRRPGIAERDSRCNQ